MKPQPDVEFAAFAGIDWSGTKHDICLQAAHSEEREFAVLPHRPAAIDAWASALRQRFAGRPVAVRPRNLTVAVECRAMQRYAKRCYYVFVYT